MFYVIYTLISMSFDFCSLNYICVLIISGENMCSQIGKYVLPVCSYLYFKEFVLFQ